VYPSIELLHCINRFLGKLFFKCIEVNDINWFFCKWLNKWQKNEKYFNVVRTGIVLTSFAHCVLVHHRLNGSSSPVLTATSLSYGESKNLTPIEIKFGMVDYVGEGTRHAKFYANSSKGGFSTNG